MRDGALSFSVAVTVAMQILGCAGGVSSPGGGGGTGGATGLNLPAGNGLAWVSQLDKQTLPPSYVPSESGSVLNTVWSIAADAQGNAIIGGYNGAEFAQATNFNWEHEAFVAKYGPSGTLEWLQQFGNNNGTPAYDDVISVFADAQGNVYAGGTTYGAFTGNVNPRNVLELMLAKFSADGTLLWVQQYTTDVIFSSLAGVALTANGNVVFAGTARGETTGSGDNTFVKVINPSTATMVWERAYTGSNDLNGFTVDAGGNFVGVGSSLGAFPGTASGTQQPFVLKLDGTSGDVLWTQQFAAYLQTNGAALGLSAVVAGASGAVVVGGASVATGNSLCQGLCTLPSVTGQGAFLAKIDDASGAIDWTESFATGEGDGITGVAADASGNIVAAGFTNGQMATPFSQPMQDLFALRMEPGGGVISVQQFGTGPWVQGSLPTQGAQVAIAATGKFFVSGETQGAFSGYSNTGQISQIFVAGFAP